MRWPHFFAVQSGLRFRRNEDPTGREQQDAFGQAYFYHTSGNANQVEAVEAKVKTSRDRQSIVA